MLPNVCRSADSGIAAWISKTNRMNPVYTDCDSFREPARLSSEWLIWEINDTFAEDVKTFFGEVQKWCWVPLELVLPAPSNPLLFLQNWTNRRISLLCFCRSKVHTGWWGCTVAAVSAQQPVEHVKNALQIITNEGTPHDVQYRACYHKRASPRVLRESRRCAGNLCAAALWAVGGVHTLIIHDNFPKYRF